MIYSLNIGHIEDINSRRRRKDLQGMWQSEYGWFKPLFRDSIYCWAVPSCGDRGICP